MGTNMAFYYFTLFTEIIYYETIYRKTIIARKKYLLLIEFEVRTVKYGPSFFPSIYGPSAKRAGHKSMGKNEDPYFTVRTEKTRLIRYLLYLSFLRKETISSQLRLHLNDARVKCKKKAKFIGLRKQFAVGSQRGESKLQTF